MSSLITGPSIWGSSGDYGLASSVDVLENKYVRTTRFEIISGTTGTVSLPANATVVLDDFGGTVDAIISTASGGLPLFANAVDAGSAIVTTSFDASGNYVLSAAPTAPQYCIIYRVKQLLVNFDSNSSNILGIPTISTTSTGAGFVPYGSANQTVFLNGMSLSASSSESTLEIAPDWNTSGNPIALKIDPNNNASDVNSKLIQASFSAAAIPLYSLYIDGRIERYPQSLQGSSDLSINYMTQEWNTSGRPSAIKIDITDTASGADSNFLQFSLNSV